jgi:hypothetical protein
MTEPESQLSLRLAAFVKQALELDEQPASLAGEILPFKRDVNSGISTIELDSSVGVAAFLIYHYQLNETNEDGRSGTELFQTDLKTLERATKINTPGPRIMAHAIAGDEAYILATTPATHRALTGSGEEGAADQPRTGERDETLVDAVRRAAATELLRLLPAANSQAKTWLEAVRSQSLSMDGEETSDDLIEFNQEETGLALFLLDEANIRQLLQLINVMLHSARSQGPEGS